MLAKTSFKKSTLSLSVSSILQWNDCPKRLCLSLFLSVITSSLYAASTENTVIDIVTQQESVNEDIRAADNSKDHAFTVEDTTQQGEYDSWEVLESMLLNRSDVQKDLSEIQLPPMDHTMSLLSEREIAEIQQTAAIAKEEATNQVSQLVTSAPIQEASRQEIAAIDEEPIQVEVLSQNLQEEGQIVLVNSQKEPSQQLSHTDVTVQDEELQQSRPGVLGRLWQRVRPNNDEMVEKIPKISAVVEIINAQNSGNVSNKKYEEALENLKDNIKAKLSTISQEVFVDRVAVAPQLKNLSTQAANAVGFYQAQFRFEHVSDKQVRVWVEPNAVVVITNQNIEFEGPEESVSHPRFQVISVLPELDEGDVFHHGIYVQTKAKIEDAASDNGFFDSLWRLHDVKITQPENTADIHLIYETGERYTLLEPEFRMSDEKKALPLRKYILEQLIPWKAGDDYTAWRVNLLANNLTNSRYFNYTLVDAIRPEPLDEALRLPADIEALIQEYNLNREDFFPSKSIQKYDSEYDSNELDTQLNESQFAGVNDKKRSKEDLDQARAAQKEREEQRKRLQSEARETRQVPVIVTLNADKLNSAELGAGFGTDTGPRVRGQYRRAIVNDRGHSFDANAELSQIRQAIDGRYNIPYKHPLNDYIAIVAGYEREERDDIGENTEMSIESAVFGTDRIIKNPRGQWQHSYGLRYRLDRLKVDGETELPPAFSGGRSDVQQSLLFGYEVSKTKTNVRVNPTRGLKQTYKAEVGSDSLLTDVNMAILNARWNALYSLNPIETANHQFVGRAELGYIFTDDFNKVPYNLRYFSGGDQTIRGFDYKSLSPEVDGYKVGGQASAIASLEYNYQFIENWRAAVFADVGNAYNEDFSNDTEYGVGLGIRWASPIGPVRIDVASGISDPGKPIRVHFFIGSSL